MRSMQLHTNNSVANSTPDDDEFQLILNYNAAKLVMKFITPTRLKLCYVIRRLCATLTFTQKLIQ